MSVIVVTRLVTSSGTLNHVNRLLIFMSSLFLCVYLYSCSPYPVSFSSSCTAALSGRSSTAIRFLKLQLLELFPFRPLHTPSVFTLNRRLIPCARHV